MDKQVLGAKEKALSQQIIRLYESRQCRKGVKLCDQILKAHPDHGETLCLKGLNLYQLNKKEECYELVRLGLRKNLRSHMSWHINALVHKADQNFNDAVKCLSQALKISEAKNVLKDLITIQALLGNYEAYAEAALRRLRADPRQTAHWVSVIVGLHLAGDSVSALTALDTFVASTGETADDRVLTGLAPYERTETLLLRNEIVGAAAAARESEEGKAKDDGAGAVSDADLARASAEARLADLEASRAKITDIEGAALLEASLLLVLGRADEARAKYEAVLDANPEHMIAWRGFRECLGLPGTGVVDPSLPAARELLKAFDAYAPKCGKPGAPRTQAVLLTEGDDFRKRVSEHAADYAARGIPSLMNTLKSLYAGRGGAVVTTSVVRASASDALNGGAAGERGRFARAEANSIPHNCNDARVADVAAALSDLAAKNAAEGGGSAAALAECYLSTHHSWTGDHAEALAHSDAALAAVNAAAEDAPAPQDESTPVGKLTAVKIDILVARAKALKRAGAFSRAADVAEAARLLDTQDRFVNTLAVKHLFRAGRNAEAEVVALAFTKDGIAGNNLADMQAMWYESHSARCYVRRGDYGRALVKHLLTLRHIFAIMEDSLDFHDFSLGRRFARAWMEMQSSLTHHEGYRYLFDASVSAVSIYTDLHDRAQKPHSALGLDDDVLDEMTPSERKKTISKAKKALAKKRAAEEEAAAAATATAGAAADAADGSKTALYTVRGGFPTQTAGFRGDSILENLLEPEVLEADPQPLVTAAQFLKPLRTHAAGRVETHAAWAAVYLRRAKPLVVARAILDAARACAGHARFPAGSGSQNPADHAVDAGADHPVVHRMAAEYIAACADEGHPMRAAVEANPTVRAVADAAVAEAIGASSLPDGKTFAAAYAARLAVPAGSSLECRVAAAVSTWLADGDSTAPAAWLMTEETVAGADHERLADALTAIRRAARPARGKKFGAAAAEGATGEFRALCASQYPSSEVFAA